jgi:hypothetical protein
MEATAANDGPTVRSGRRSPAKTGIGEIHVAVEVGFVLVTLTLLVV